MTAKNACSDMGGGFLFGGLSPPNKKIISLRSQRLCGEISILDAEVLKDAILKNDCAVLGSNKKFLTWRPACDAKFQ
jgi:hypothetical protein